MPRRGPRSACSRFPITELREEISDCKPCTSTWVCRPSSLAWTARKALATALAPATASLCDAPLNLIDRMVSLNGRPE